jgi:hypothetical protein
MAQLVCLHSMMYWSNLQVQCVQAVANQGRNMLRACKGAASRCARSADDFADSRWADDRLWCCCVLQIDPAQVLGGASMNLSQTTLLALVHQLSANLASDADLKLAWLAEAAPAVDPHDPMTEPHLRSVLSGVMNSLKQLVMSLPQTDAMAKQGKITLHLFNSLLHQ